MAKTANTSDCSSNKKRIYLKFSKAKLEALQKAYKQSPYPTKKEIEDLAKSQNETFQRVYTWFRGQRRKLFQQGALKHERKNVFSEHEKHMLEEVYLRNPYPTTEDIENIAIKMKTTTKVIRNWFGYQRKLERKQKIKKTNPKIENIPQTPISCSQTTIRPKMFIQNANPCNMNILGVGYLLVPRNSFMFQRNPIQHYYNFF